jgi:hypothetical protein
MNDVAEVHWDHTICEETLEALAYSRTNLLLHQGMNRQAARHLALLESQKRQELAQTVGFDAALLARLEWEDHGDLGFVCRLVLDDMPATACEGFLIAFDLPSFGGKGA